MSVTHYAIEELQPGMILGQAITDDKGRTLIPDGARLTPMYIKRLEKWGITNVSIQAEESANSSSASLATGRDLIEQATDEEKELMRKMALTVQRRFNLVDENQIMGEMKRLTLRHLVLGGKGTPGLDIK